MADQTVGVQGPYEGAVIALAGLLGKLIDGQSPEQRVKLWQNWIDFWQPLVDLMVKK